MPEFYELAGAHLVNRWVWQKLQDVGLMVAADYPFRPIVPIQETPEVQSLPGDKPYIVYGYVHAPAGHDWWVKSEQLTYIVYSTNEQKIRQISNYLKDLFDRWDWTAQNINNYLISVNGTNKFDFKTFEVLTATGPEPFTNEGGRHSAVVAIRYDYTVEIDGAHFEGMRA